MVAFNDINSSPVTERADGLKAEQTYSAACSNENADPLLQAASQAPRFNNAGRTAHAFLKPLIAFATAQYVIVTILVVLSAMVIVSRAGNSINAKLEPIVAALKRL